MSEDLRNCTCHPTDRPPICQHRYAVTECRDAYRAYKATRVTVSCLCGTQGCNAETCNPTTFKAATMSVENRDLRAALQKRDQEIAELKEELSDAREMLGREALASSRLASQIHAANNELMSLRAERNALRQKIEAHNRLAAHSEVIDLDEICG